MTDPKDDKSLIRLSSRERTAGIALLSFLALVHLALPSVNIDLTLIGLLGGGLFLRYFDIESVDFMGVKARRRELESVTAAVEQSELPAGTATPTLPSPFEMVEAGANLRGSASVSATAASTTAVDEDEMPPAQPLERLLWAYEMVRRELTIIAGSAGRLDSRHLLSSYPMRSLISAVSDTGLLPPEVRNGIEALTKARNEAAHFASDLRLVEPAGNLGLEILSKLRRVGRTYVRVRHGDVALYGDPNLTRERPERGAIIVQLRTDGSIAYVHVVPRRREYTRGSFTSWEWDFDGVVDEQTWYRDPDSGRTISAFTASAFFAGREYPAEWNLVRRLTNPKAGLSDSDRDSG